MIGNSSVFSLITITKLMSLSTMFFNLAIVPRTVAGVEFEDEGNLRQI